MRRVVFVLVCCLVLLPRLARAQDNPYNPENDPEWAAESYDDGQTWHTTAGDTIRGSVWDIIAVACAGNGLWRNAAFYLDGFYAPMFTGYVATACGFAGIYRVWAGYYRQLQAQQVLICQPNVPESCHYVSLADLVFMWND